MGSLNINKHVYHKTSINYVLYSGYQRALPIRYLIVMILGYVYYVYLVYIIQYTNTSR